MKQYELSGRKYFLYAAFLFLSLFFFISRYMSNQPGLLERFAGALLFPIVRLQSTISQPIQNYYQGKKDFATLSSQLDYLQKQNQDLLAENTELKATLNYHSATKELAWFRKRYSTYVCTSQIILRQFTDAAQHIFIDQGRHAGVEQDMIAVYKNSLVGRVDKVYGNYSRIALVTDRDCKIAAYCHGTKLKGIYEGRASLESAELMHIDHLQKPKEDDLILSSGEGLIYPAGFSLGRIAEISNQGVNHKIVVKPLHDIGKLNYCYLIKSKLNS